jgi:O-antigen ligase
MLPLERLVAIAAWILVVLTVQPWTRPPRGPQATVSGGTDTGKGVLIAAVFMMAVVLAAPRFRIRVPVVYLFYFLYLSVAAATAFHLLEPMAPLLRVVRLGLAIMIPLLLWRWLSANPSQFIRAHRTAHVLLALTVLAGLAAFPGSAWPGRSFGNGGRLYGGLLPMLPPRVGEIGAIVAGLTIVALAFGRLGRLYGGAFIGLGLLLIVLSRTRTAAMAMIIGLLAAFFMARQSRRGRRALRVLVLLIILAIPLLTPVRSWVVRDQTSTELTTLTGRTTAWSFVIEQEASIRTVMLGHGLGNKRVLLRRGEGDIDVMAIDNGWLSLFWETGWLGVTLVLFAVIAAFITAWRAPTPYIRAASMFLIVYVVVTSFTESGLSDLSSLTLHLLVASAAAYADRFVVRGQRFVVPALAPVRTLQPTRLQ